MLWRKNSALRVEVALRREPLEWVQEFCTVSLFCSHQTSCLRVGLDRGIRSHPGAKSSGTHHTQRLGVHQVSRRRRRPDWSDRSFSHGNKWLTSVSAHLIHLRLTSPQQRLILKLRFFIVTPLLSHLHFNTRQESCTSTPSWTLLDFSSYSSVWEQKRKRWGRIKRHSHCLVAANVLPPLQNFPSG